MIDQSILSQRVVVLDTETTGFHYDKDDRVIEVGIIEMINREITDNSFHVYIDPKRDVPEEAYAVHGLSRDDLVKLSKGREFNDIADAMMAFIGNSPIVAHNARFDMRFLDAELTRAGKQTITERGNLVFDSLQYANIKYPGQANSLDALCRRLIGKENYSRDLHGALLDASLLAMVFRIMTIQQGGLDLNANRAVGPGPLKPERLSIEPGSLLLAPMTDQDRAAHEAMIKKIEKEASLSASMGSLSF